jgi:hypothetical protein
MARHIDGALRLALRLLGEAKTEAQQAEAFADVSALLRLMVLDLVERFREVLPQDVRKGVAPTPVVYYVAGLLAGEVLFRVGVLIDKDHAVEVVSDACEEIRSAHTPSR